ncbi:hypothetical protein [Haladaptatus sp. CMAA 1911]|uniref:hypothetical protein n=1 Tax=unclassified Haladaptatus TaxID=2622732 RepID=UPI00375486BF
MSEKPNVPDVKHTVERLIENGSQFDVEVLDRIYHEQLRIVHIDETGTVSTLNRAENIALFREARDSGAETLSTNAEFDCVGADTGEGGVLVTRRMRSQVRPEKSIFSIRLVQGDGRWQVIHETAFVQPMADCFPVENPRVQVIPADSRRRYR